MTAIDAHRLGTALLSGLTDQEQKLLGLLAEGLTNRQIANRMYLGEKTVRNYITALLAKLRMERTQAAAWWTVANGHAPTLRRPNLSGRGRLRARATKPARYGDAAERVDVHATPWALLVFREGKDPVDTATYFATNTEAEAEAEAQDLRKNEIVIVNVTATAKSRILDDERPALLDDDHLDDHHDDDDEPCSTGSSRTETWKAYKKGKSQPQPASHPRRGDVRSTIPATTITGNGVLTAAAAADRLLAQI